MPGSMRVRDVMTDAIVILRTDTPLLEAWSQMHGAGIQGAPVVDHRGRLAGLLSMADLADPRRALTDQSTVLDAMTRFVYAVRADDPLSTAVHLMLREHIHRAVVVHEDGSLAGIVVPMDILKAIFGAEEEGVSFVDVRDLGGAG